MTCLWTWPCLLRPRCSIQ
ncbi:hypothetical protein cypCar_00023463 [Cyprinus carpio]|nr:hypothetical protein cypCar_00023463 [Cyprinus carpio]